MMRSEPEGLGFEVCERLDTLKRIFRHLEGIDATHPQLVNILAVMKAYRSGMKIQEGMVTYWADGLKLCEPRPLNWEEFIEFGTKYGADQQKLWLEEVSYLFVSLHPGPLMRIIVGATTGHPAGSNLTSSSI